MNIIDLGWGQYTEEFPQYKKQNKETVARVAAENKTNYVLFSNFGELEGLVRGSFLNNATENSEFPKVGDWVEIQKLQGEDKAVIKSILPRKTTISRAAALKKTQQVIATNVDIIFIIQALDSNFNLRRLERYVVTAKESGCQAVIILNKTDLEDSGKKAEEVRKALPGLLVFSLSAKTGAGMQVIEYLLEPGKTVVFMGSSGVGKTTLINYLTGASNLKAGELGQGGKGKHTTTRRELVLLPDGAILIDTPGMRELGLWVSDEAVDESFLDIQELSKKCEFGNCDHIKSSGCAVLKALSEGVLGQARYESYLKLFSEADVIRPKTKETPKEMMKRKSKYKKMQKNYNRDLWKEY